MELCESLLEIAKNEDIDILTEKTYLGPRELLMKYGVDEKKIRIFEKIMGCDIFEKVDWENTDDYDPKVMASTVSRQTGLRRSIVREVIDTLFSINSYPSIDGCPDMEFRFEHEDDVLTVYDTGTEPSSLHIPAYVRKGNRLYKVAIIGEDAFESNDMLREITIPDTIVSIEERAFFDCSNLNCVHIPDSVMDMGRQAFAGSGYVECNTARLKTLRGIVYNDSMTEVFHVPSTSRM